MAWRHKKLGTVRSDELWSPAAPASTTRKTMNGLSLATGRPPEELALPPLAKVRLSCRQLGSFRGKKIYETGLSLLQFH